MNIIFNTDTAAASKDPAACFTTPEPIVLLDSLLQDHLGSASKIDN